MILYKTDLVGIATEQLKNFFVGWKEPLLPEDHMQILQNSYRFVLAIDIETNMVVGFINALSDKIQFAFIPMLEVLPDYQNKGIGTKLMEILLSKLVHIDCIDLTCDPEKQSFYERFNMLKSHGMVIRRYLI
ncbi:MAG: GNAT family N-acetyltransferase [Bacteroidetes bacterium]|nr:GNAT family N-acetyltransferase [Bacteroidota bacterium]